MNHSLPRKIWHSSFPTRVFDSKRSRLISDCQFPSLFSQQSWIVIQTGLEDFSRSKTFGEVESEHRKVRNLSQFESIHSRISLKRAVNWTTCQPSFSLFRIPTISSRNVEFHWKINKLSFLGTSDMNSSLLTWMN